MTSLQGSNSRTSTLRSVSGRNNASISRTCGENLSNNNNARKSHGSSATNKGRESLISIATASTTTAATIASSQNTRHVNKLQSLPTANAKQKERENYIPSYLRGTASSLLKAVDHSNANNNHHQGISSASKKSTANSSKSSSNLKKSISFKINLDTNTSLTSKGKYSRLSGSTSSSNLLNKKTAIYPDTYYHSNSTIVPTKSTLSDVPLNKMPEASLKSTNDKFALQKLPKVNPASKNTTNATINASKSYRSVSDSSASLQHLPRQAAQLQRNDRRVVSNDHRLDQPNCSKNNKLSLHGDGLSSNSSDAMQATITTSHSSPHRIKPLISNSTSAKQVFLTKKQIRSLNKHSDATTSSSSSTISSLSKSPISSSISLSNISNAKNSTTFTIRNISALPLSKDSLLPLNKKYAQRHRNSSLSVPKSGTTQTLSKAISSNKGLPKSVSSYSSPSPSVLASKISNSSHSSSMDSKIHRLSELYSFLRQSPDTAEMIIDDNHDGFLNRHKDCIPPISVKDILSNNDKGGAKFRRLDFYETNELSRRNKEIYYLGDKNSKVEISNMKNNLGLDDNNQNYIVEIGDHIDYRYEVLQFLGTGNFGKVLKCKDHKNGEIVAVKIIKNDFKWSLQAMYEIKILKELSNNDINSKNSICESHILRYLDHYNFRSHMCITTELLSVTLFQCLEVSNFNGFCIPILMSWTKQVLLALKFIHSHNIIHCDLKPENIMLSNLNNKQGSSSPYSLNIKIIDFGSSCHVNELAYTYIQSRFYRAPEVILGAYYDTKIDIWSLGCIFAELYTGEPLLESKNEINHLELLINFFGAPDKNMILGMRDELRRNGPIGKLNNKAKTNSQIIDDYLSTHLNKQFDKYGNYSPRRISSSYSTAGSLGATGFTKHEISSNNNYNSNNLIARKNLSHILFKSSSLMIGQGNLEKLFLDFLSKILLWNSADRLSAVELLSSDFLNYYDDHCISIESNISK